LKAYLDCSLFVDYEYAFKSLEFRVEHRTQCYTYPVLIDGGYGIRIFDAISK